MPNEKRGAKTMKTRTINYNTFNFEELNIEGKAKAINDNRYINTEDLYWYSFTLDYWTEKLNKIGFANAEIYFSGFHSQGDGACFDADIDIDKFLEKPKYKKLQKISDVVQGDIETVNAFYCNESTKKTRLYYDWSLSYKHPRIENLIIELRNDIENSRKNLCVQIYKELRSEYNSLTSDQAITDTLISNHYEFLKDGSFFNLNQARCA